MTTTARDRWISAETEAKEADFRGIFRMHVQICKGIMQRQKTGPYLYADLYAGPGHLEHKGRHFLGSPLIAQEEIAKAGIRYEALHFEKDPAVAARLAEVLWAPTSLVDCPDPGGAPIFAEDFRSGFSRWLDERGRQADRYGLVYADPINEEIPHDLLNKTAQHLPKVDLLSYASANQYKRRRGEDIKRNGTTDRPLIGDHIAAVDKRVVLIRKPIGKWQWTFLLWSNWVRLPEWERRGFHRLDTEAGQRILDQLNLTNSQQKARANTPLWEDEPR